jgi:hypothetical protein
VAITLMDPSQGVGPTTELSLRVSVATLSRLLFPRPEDGLPLLGLENKATLVPGGDEDQVVVSAQPFGGAVRLLNLNGLLKHASRFNFDSQRSRAEADFRVFIPPSNWDAVREYCLRHLGLEDSPDLECDPSRELVEEVYDTLGVQLKPGQYTLRPVRTVIENDPTPTSNLRAAGRLTARIYRIYEVYILDPTLQRMMTANSQAHPGHVLRRMALEDTQKGGRGRANAMLVAPLEEIRQAYLKIPPEKRGRQLPFKNTLLAGNVAAVLEGVSVPKYQWG